MFEMVQDSVIANSMAKYTVKGGAITNPASAYPRVSSHYAFDINFKAYSIGIRLVLIFIK